MSKDLKRGKKGTASDNAEEVVVAVKASRAIPKTALLWALTHVVQPGDCIILLVVVPAQSSGKKLWGFPRFSGDCASGLRKSNMGSSSSEQKFDISDTYSQMILKLQDVYDPAKINVKIKTISGSPCGGVAEEVKRTRANWVVLDKHLKHEQKRCMEDLQCNIVAIKRSQPKILRLNLVGLSKKESEASPPSLKELQPSGSQGSENDSANSSRVPVATPASSPEVFTATDAGTSSVSSSDPGTSPFTANEINKDFKEKNSLVLKEDRDLDESGSDTESENPSASSSLRFEPWMIDIITSRCKSSQWLEEHSTRTNDSSRVSTSKSILEKLSNLDEEAWLRTPSYRSEIDCNTNLREAISLSRSAPPGPPPLCSICQHKAPVFGKPPTWFSYAELELATGGFSQANFLAEGGFGSVYRGVLPDGQVIAVKQHKLASSQGDQEFCSEVEVLSCAQHRNVVMLIGFCIEDGRRLLVYEYICNGSLDSHLYGRHQDTLEWSARQKIAVGAARGLRYLHEESRVGCIVHRDMRPNNILITHDFEPLVGDFGLARWQPDGDKGVETRVIGTFGYLAPEYAQTGQITEKADVYSFGVVLVELVTGRKAVDLNRPKGQQCLTEWARPLLDEVAIGKLVDPRLGNDFSEQEVHYMLHAASLCIRRDPQTRPRMSQVLRVLEGDPFLDTSHISSPGHDIGSRSGRFRTDGQQKQKQYSPLHTEAKGGFSEMRQIYWEREKARTSYISDL